MPTARRAMRDVPRRPGRHLHRRDGRVTINPTLRVQTAYRSAAARIVGGPTWIDSDRFDVNAKAEAPTSQDQLALMMRTLLADRFRLAVHTESRTTDIYALVLARGDGRLGPNLKVAAADCATLRAAAAEPSQRATTLPCGFLAQPARFAGRGFRLDEIAGMLSTATNPIRVVNKTGLAGPLITTSNGRRPGGVARIRPSTLMAHPSLQLFRNNLA